MHLAQRLTYANVMATLALFVALSGTAVAGSKVLFTGADVKDQSLTGKDIRSGSLGAYHFSKSALRSLRGNTGPRGSNGVKGDSGPQGPIGPQGIAGAQGAQGPQGVGITTASAPGTDATNYQDLTPLATLALTTPGDYVIFTTFTADNTGSNNEYLNCGYRFAGALNGAAGADTTAGLSTTTTSAGVLNAESPGTVEFVCAGNGHTTYDLHGIRMRAHYLG